MKKHVIIILICMLILLSTQQVTGSFNRTHQKIQQKIKSMDTAELNYELPQWSMGDYWTYQLDFSFEMRDTDYDISINLYLNSLDWTVVGTTTNEYTMSLESPVSGNLYADIESVPTVKATLKQTNLDGSATIEKQNLALSYMDLEITGKVTIGIVPIPLEIDVIIDFIPSYSPLDFPLYIGKEWLVNGTTVNIEGLVRLQGISTLFKNIPDEIEVPTQSAYISENTATCQQQENVTISSIYYNTYNISLGDSYSIYYAPAMGNILTFLPLKENPDYFNADFSYLFRSTNYIVPGSPEIPGPPTGSTQGKPLTEYSYTAQTTDPEQNQIYYSFDWGDGELSHWIGPFNSGEPCETSHIWSEQGTYYVKVRAKDTENHESRWSDPLPVSMPKRGLLNILSLFHLISFQSMH